MHVKPDLSAVDRSLAAIIVTFNPDVTALMRLVNRLESDACDYVVVDNASSNLAEFAPGLRAGSRCLTLEVLPHNEGQASALNRGLCYLQESGYAHALLFDQDSSISPGFHQRMLQALDDARLLSDAPVAALGPRIEDPATGRRTPFKDHDRWFLRSDRELRPGSGLYRVGFLITSGTLLDLRCLDDVGYMKESYFIDNVDLEWCFRARSRSYTLLGTDRATLFHRIGEDSRNPLVRRGLMVNHGPARSYYSTRNRLDLYRQQYTPFNWKWRDCIRFALKSLGLMIFSPQRRQYWRNIRRGIADSGSLG